MGRVKELLLIREEKDLLKDENILDLFEGEVDVVIDDES